MVSISAVRESNKAFKNTSIKPTAVFVGATSGIGEAAVKEYAAHTTQPTIYLVGRNEAAANRILDEMRKLNADGTYIFRQANVSLIKNVDAVCDEIKQKEKKLDVLCMSPGYLSFGGRHENEDGIDDTLALRYYIRLRFVSQLTSLLLLSPAPRVLSILAGGREGPLNEADLELRDNFSLSQSAVHNSTMTTFAFEHVATVNPSISFVHTFPGVVKTNLFNAGGGSNGAGFSPVTSFLLRWVLLPLITPFTVSVEESGERQLFHLTSAKYPSAASTKAAKTGGVPLPAGVEVAKGSNGKVGSGVYSVGWNGEPEGDEKFMRESREKGLAKTIWEHTNALYERVLSQGK